MNNQEEYLLEKFNQERTLRGKQPLSPCSHLTQLALLKSSDMVNNNYFSHMSSTYGRVNDMLKSHGVTYYLAGENLAKAINVQSAFNLFMNSAAHRANILLSSFKTVGIGIVSQKSGSGVIVTVIFVSL